MKTTKLMLITALAIAALVPQQSRAMNWQKWTKFGVQTALVGIILYNAYTTFYNDDNFEDSEGNFEDENDNRNEKNYTNKNSDTMYVHQISTYLKICIQNNDLANLKKELQPLQDNHQDCLKKIYQHKFNNKGSTIVELAKGTSAETIINTYNPFKKDAIEKFEISSNKEEENDDNKVEIKLNEYNKDKKVTKKKFDYSTTFTASEYAEEIKRCIESKNPYDQLRIEDLFELVQYKKLLKEVCKHNFSEHPHEDIRLWKIAEKTPYKDLVEKYYQLCVQTNLGKKN